MKKFSFVILIFMVSLITAKAQPVNAIHLNSLGFLTENKKTAVVTRECSAFRIVDAATSREVFQEKPPGQNFRKM
jgi:hypothetical protein